MRARGRDTTTAVNNGTAGVADGINAPVDSGSGSRWGRGGYRGDLGAPSADQLEFLSFFFSLKTRQALV